MAKPEKGKRRVRVPRLSVGERREIDLKIKFETSKSFHSMVKLGACANVIGAFFYVLAIYNPQKPFLLITWYLTLVAANIINVIWAWNFEYTNITPEEIHRCRKGFIYILILICLIWSSISILFMSDGSQQQMTTTIFLLAVLICFLFSTAIDLTMCIISIFCLLSPSILYHFYNILFHHNEIHSGIDNAFIASFLVLGLFMLIACFVGNKVIIKVFRLGYENVLLNQKLASMNNLLEDRVKERTEELEMSLKLVTYQSTHDLLTELPNERLLYTHIEQATERASKSHKKYAVLCFSLNGMMKIKDSIGHQASTTIIHRVSQRFAPLVEKYGGRFFVSLARQDVFVILIEGIGEFQDINEDVQELFAVLNDPVYVVRRELKLTGSIGVSIFPDHGRDVDTLITNAEAARVLASQNGGNSLRLYTTVINADASRLLNIENLLYHAIAKDELLLHYQPYIDLTTGKICGAEALVRWKSPELGMVSPLDFISIAETNGLIVPIGEWVLKTGCAQLKQWQNKGFKNFKLSINLSAKQLMQPNLVESIEGLLKKLNVGPEFIDLELTESNAFHKEVLPIINKFSELGISLSIDDFGTGYSEFSSLKLFKVDKIKIDKLFIQDIDINVDSRNIVCNTIALAKSMGIRCLAEGVETDQQLNFLKENGCYMIQGYYFSKPLPADDFLEFLKTH